MKKELEISINIENDNRKKLAVMSECDSSFSSSVIKRDDFEEIFEKISNYAYFVVAKNTCYNHITGFATVYANDVINKQAYISFLCVKKDFQKKGIGKLLINKCIEIAKKNKMKTIKLEVNANNYNAINFYTANNFFKESYNKDNNSHYMVRNIDSL